MTPADPRNMPPNVLELLGGMAFPASRAEIVEYALEQDAGKDALRMLDVMPDRIYEDIHDVNRGIGKIQDLPGTDDGYWPAAEEASLPDETAARTTKLRGKGQL